MKKIIVNKEDVPLSYSYFMDFTNIPFCHFPWIRGNNLDLEAFKKSVFENIKKYEQSRDQRDKCDVTPTDLIIIYDIYTFPEEYPTNIQKFIIDDLIKKNIVNKVFFKNLNYDYKRKLPNSLQDRICFLPLGIDLHTLKSKAMNYSPQKTLNEQLSDLSNIKKKYLSEPRELKIAITFPLDISKVYTDKRIEYLSKFYNKKFITRKQTVNYLKDKEYIKICKNINRLESWELMSECVFTISPLGSGFDCHRTWEALYLGSIVIIPTSPVSQFLLDLGLPVVVITSLEEITPSNMNKWLDENKNKINSEISQTPICGEYWKNINCK